MTRIKEAIILRDRHRPEEALRLLMLELVEAPDDDYLHFQICVTLLDIPKNERKALMHIRKAIGIDPDSPDYIAYEAHVLNQLERNPEALVSANRALSMDAETQMAWIAKSFAYCGMELWDKMETTAREGLEIYPDDESLSHALAISLRMQGNLQESGNVVAGRLERDPDNDMNLANAAWVDIHAGRYKEAEEKFLAALRIDPENEYARDGLREAYKSRSLAYRLYLRLCLRMARVPEGTRTAIFIGMFVAYKFLASGAKLIHPALGGAIVILWLAFVFWAHVVNSIMHAILLKDRIARHSLNKRERWDGAIASCFILLGIALVGFGFVSNNNLIMHAGILSIATLLSSSHIACNRLAGMLVYGAVTLFSCVCIILTILGFGAAYWLGIAVVMLSTWLSFISYLNRQASD